MPELDTEPSAELLTPVAETVSETETATPGPDETVRDTPGEVVSRLGETVALEGGLTPPPEPAAALIGHPAYAMTANASQKARLLLDLQRRYGNAYIQEVMTLVRPQRPVSPPAAPEEIAPDSAAEAPAPGPTASPPPASEPPTMAATVDTAPPFPPAEPSTPEVTPPQAMMPVAPETTVTPEVTSLKAMMPAAPETTRTPKVLPPQTMPVAPETTAAPSALPPGTPLAAPAAPEVGTPEETAASALEQEEEAPEAAAAPASGAMEGSPEAATTAAEAGAETETPMAVAPETAAEEKTAAGAPQETAGAAPQAADKAPTSPQEDPAFQAVVQRSQGVAVAQRSHAPAAAGAAAAQAAAVGPSNEVASSAAGAQVGKMDAQEPRQFDRAAFKAALLQKIAQTAPSTLKEADEFKESGKLDTVKRDVTSKVAEGKAQAQGNIAETAQETPDTTGITPKPVTPLEPSDAGLPPADIGATAAAPKPKTEAEVSLQEGSDTLEHQMHDNEITEPQLAQSGEPDFQGALASKKTAQKDAQEAPQAYRQQEQGIVAGAQATAETSAQVQLDAMHGQRASVLAQVSTAQVETRGVDEQKRAEVANHIEEIYQRTKASVEARLQSLDDAVNQAFDTGSAQAQQAFEAHVERRMEDYKDERYSGVRGKYRWVRDKFAGLPDEVNVFYEEGRKLYLSMMDGVLENIAIIVETGLNDAKATIALGKQDVQDYVASLPIDLQEVGQQAAGQIQTKFADLEQQVNDKQGELVDALARKYQENLQKLDARIEEMKAANRGLIAAAFDAIAGVIKTILELKNMLLNVLARAVSVIGTIISDPIGFLGNLVSGVMQGLRNFMANLAQHLKKGLLDWLFGALAGAGIQMPESFDLKGILSLVLQVLGLTYANIRARAVNIVGEPIVARLEQAAEIFKIMITEGPAGLWNWIKDKVGDLKAMVLDGIQSFIMEKVIIAGITWIISLLNPASAFIKACKAIYDIVMFFVQRGSQIIELVNAVLDSVTAIAQGALGAAANAVENALAKAIPVVIGFLASLLGLGGISDKIRAIIDKIRAPINAAIDWVITKAVQLVKAAGKWLGIGKEKESAEDKKNLEPDDRTDEQKQQDLQQAVAEAQALDANQLQPSTISPALEKIREQYRLTELKATFTNGIFNVHAAVNPEITFQLASDDWLAQKIGLAVRPKIDALPGSASIADVRRVLTEAMKEVFAAPHLDVKKANLSFEPAKTGKGLPIENVFLFYNNTKTELGAIWHQSDLYEEVANPVEGPASTFKNRVTSEIYVHDNKKQYVQRYLIRNISDADVKSMRSKGTIEPTGPRHRTTIQQHVMGVKPSPYISATKAPEGQIINEKGETFNSGERVRIDLCHISSKNLFDLSTRVGQDEWGLSDPKSEKAEQALKDVIRTQEVLIKQTIPPQALEKI